MSYLDIIVSIAEKSARNAFEMFIITIILRNIEGFSSIAKYRMAQYIV